MGFKLVMLDRCFVVSGWFVLCHCVSVVGLVQRLFAKVLYGCLLFICVPAFFCSGCWVYMRHALVNGWEEMVG